MIRVEIIFLTLSIISLLCFFVSILMTAYLGKYKIKYVDQKVLGYELSGDSTFIKCRAYQGMACICLSLECETR